ncbi:MAG: substrate-binding domain-containing protein [Microbacterium sp.]
MIASLRSRHKPVTQSRSCIVAPSLPSNESAPISGRPRGRRASPLREGRSSDQRSGQSVMAARPASKWSVPGRSKNPWRDSGMIRWLVLHPDNDDIVAAGAGTALRLGIRVPEELSVIGHDDAPIAQMFEPQLSTVRVDIIGPGRYFAALAVSAVEGTAVPPPGPAAAVELVERASSAPRSK